MSPDLPETIGVIGAGTMGAGIAQLAAQTGARTLLHDPVREALESGIAGIGTGAFRIHADDDVDGRGHGFGAPLNRTAL